MDRKIIMTTLCALFLVGGTCAQELSQPFSLKQCIIYAQEHNIQILRQQEEVRTADINVLQAKLNYIPSLSAGVGASTSFGRSRDESQYAVNPNTTAFSASGSVGLSTELFGGLEKYHSLKRAELNLRSTLLGIEKAKNDLALNVTAAYLEILFAEERVKISENQVATLREQLARTSKLVEAGKATEGERLQLEAQLADAENELISLKGSRTMAYFNLSQLLEIDDYENFRIVIPEALTIGSGQLPSAEEIIEQAQSLPQIADAQVKMEIARRNLSIARAAYYPTLSLSAGYGSSYYELLQPKPVMGTDPFFTQWRDKGSSYFSLNLNIPIWNSLRTRNNVRMNKVAQTQAEFDLQLARKQLRKEVQTASIDVTTAYEEYIASQKNVETNEESFRHVQRKFDAGAATSVDYNVALGNLVKAQGRLAQALFQYVFKTKILDFYMGREITLD